MQERNEPEIEQLYRQVMDYDRKGDVYMAVKVCKRLARLAPDWSAPFAWLGALYKSRQEWKPTFHYCLKSLEHNPFDEATLKHLALAATALGEWEIARYAWNELGFQFKKSDEALQLDLGIVPVRLLSAGQAELIEASRTDPVRAFVQSIPQPSSGRRYQDFILLDNTPGDRLYLHGKKIPVYDELQLLKPSRWRTYAVMLRTGSQKHVETLAGLCEESNLGFDNWSNARRFFRTGLHPKIAEYFDHSFFGDMERDRFLVAIAALDEKSVDAVLKNWEVITLQRFDGLERLI